MTTSFPLQDWKHLEAPEGVSVVQTEVRWLDLSSFVDVEFFLTVKYVASTTDIAYETSPSKDDDLFQPMATPRVTAATARTVSKILFSDPTNTEPLARWVRWKITPVEGSLAITFRIWVSAVSRGRAVAVPEVVRSRASLVSGAAPYPRPPALHGLRQSIGVRQDDLDPALLR